MRYNPIVAKPRTKGAMHEYVMAITAKLLSSLAGHWTDSCSILLPYHWKDSSQAPAVEGDPALVCFPWGLVEDPSKYIEYDQGSKLEQGTGCN